MLTVSSRNTFNVLMTCELPRDGNWKNAPIKIADNIGIVAFRATRWRK